MNMKKIKNLAIPIISILIAQAAGLIGSIFTITSLESWYQTINTPSWNPPSWLFGPVWTLLYLSMSISLYLIWNQKDGVKTKTALIFFAIQLGLNTLWSIVFFGMRLPSAAFVEILILLIFIVLTIIKFFSISKVSAYLLIPYLLWVSFASLLNLYIVRLN